MNILIGGGASSGKTDFAQSHALRFANVNMNINMNINMGEGETVLKHYYVATMQPTDSEDFARIFAHIVHRAGMGFETIERSRDIAAILDLPYVDHDGVFLIDSVTALFSNECFSPARDFIPDPEALDRTLKGLLQIMNTVRHTILVTDVPFFGGEHLDPNIEVFLRDFAMLNRALALNCQCVFEVSSGLIAPFFNYT